MNSSILVASRTNVSWKCNGVYGCILTFLFLNSCLCFLFRSFRCSLYSLALKLKFSSELFSFSQYLGLSIKFLERNNFPTLGIKTLQTELKFRIYQTLKCLQLQKIILTFDLVLFEINYDVYCITINSPILSCPRNYNILNFTY